jgi:acyl-coenzyme A thioesterase PaaI-like protein
MTEPTPTGPTPTGPTVAMLEYEGAGEPIAPVGERILDLSELVRARPTDRPDHFVVLVPDGVQQGRGAWGGVAAGAITSAALQVAPRPGQLVRTMSAQLIAPLQAGRALLRTEILRSGSSTTTVAVRVIDEAGDVAAHGIVVLGGPRVGEEMPDGPGWGKVEPPRELAAGPNGMVAVPAGTGFPDFIRQFELAPTSGLPYTGVPGAEASGWLRPAGPVGRVGAELLGALADTWWIAVIAGMSRPRPVGTLGFACELPGDPGRLRRDADGRLEPLYHRGRVLAAHEGYAVETRELWTAAGDLLTWNTQTVAVIK